MCRCWANKNKEQVMLMNIKGEKTKLPDFLIVGAARSGTTTLYHCLKQHRDIFMPERKEPFFFSSGGRLPIYTDSDLRGNIIWQIEDYIRLFENAANGQVIGEASTSYLYAYDTSIGHIKSVYGDSFGDLKIIAILRNPADRAFSHYMFLMKHGIESLPFAEAIKPDVIRKRVSERWGYDYIKYGMYYKQILAYSKEFKYVKWFLYEDLDDPDKLFSDMFSFLEVDSIDAVEGKIRANISGIPRNWLTHGLVKDNRIKSFLRYVLPERLKARLSRYNEILVSKMVIRPGMDISTRRVLASTFRDDILNLQGLIKRDLSAWLKC